MWEIICARSLPILRAKRARGRMVSHVAHPARRAQINKLLWCIWSFGIWDAHIRATFVSKKIAYGVARV